MNRKSKYSLNGTEKEERNKTFSKEFMQYLNEWLIEPLSDFDKEFLPSDKRHKRSKTLFIEELEELTETGVSPNFIKNIETEKYFPDKAQFEAICEILTKKPEDFTFGYSSKSLYKYSSDYQNAFNKLIEMECKDFGLDINLLKLLNNEISIDIIPSHRGIMIKQDNNGISYFSQIDKNDDLNPAPMTENNGEIFQYKTDEGIYNLNFMDIEFLKEVQDSVIKLIGLACSIRRIEINQYITTLNYSYSQEEITQKMKESSGLLPFNFKKKNWLYEVCKFLIDTNEIPTKREG